MDDTSPPAPPNAPTPPPARPPRRGFPPSSLIFFAVAIVLGVLAVLLATGTIGTSSPPPPPPTPGRMTQIDVVEALRAQGLTAEIDRQLFVLPGALGQPGQGVRVADEPLYVFFFDDPEQAAVELARADPASVLPPPPGSGGSAAAGAEAVGVTGGAPFIVQGSNVVVAMPGGDEETRARVRTAIEGLPS
ncbi:MAG: hypothetical protein H0U10_15115 [Chloroflexia bacterium]|nr:hypothetical protein [Chloroflexia bacterium]